MTKTLIPARQERDLTPEERISRAAEATRLLEHPLMTEAFVNIQLDYFEAWCQTPPDKVNDRDAIYHAARVVADVQAHLRSIIASGKLTQANIDKITSRNAGRA